MKPPNSGHLSIYIHTHPYTYTDVCMYTYMYMYINIARILRDPDIVKSLPSSSVKFPIPMVTYKLTPPISTKFFNFNKFVNNLDLDLFLTNPDSLPCKCNNSPFVDRYHKHIVTGNLRIIKNNDLRKLFIKGLE